MMATDRFLLLLLVSCACAANIAVRRILPYFSIRPENLYEVKPGSSINITCEAVGDSGEVPFVKWRKGLIDITPDHTIPNGRNVLLLANITTSENYTCIATSRLGNIESTAQVVALGGLETRLHPLFNTSSDSSSQDKPLAFNNQEKNTAVVNSTVEVNSNNSLLETPDSQQNAVENKIKKNDVLLKETTDSEFVPTQNLLLIVSNNSIEKNSNSNDSILSMPISSTLNTPNNVNIETNFNFTTIETPKISASTIITNNTLVNTGTNSTTPAIAELKTTTETSSVSIFSMSVTLPTTSEKELTIANKTAEKENYVSMSTTNKETEPTNELKTSELTLSEEHETTTEKFKTLEFSTENTKSAVNEQQQLKTENITPGNTETTASDKQQSSTQKITPENTESTISVKQQSSTQKTPENAESTTSEKQQSSTQKIISENTDSTASEKQQSSTQKITTVNADPVENDKKEVEESPSTETEITSIIPTTSIKENDTNFKEIKKSVIMIYNPSITTLKLALSGVFLAFSLIALAVLITYVLKNRKRSIPYVELSLEP